MPALVVVRIGTVVPGHGNGSPVDLDGFLYRIFFRRTITVVFFEGTHAVNNDGPTFMFLLLAQDDVLVQGNIVIGLAILSGADHFQVAALDGSPVGRCLLAAHTHRGMFGRQGADRFQLGRFTASVSSLPAATPVI